jgi:hypothetical protein
MGFRVSISRTVDFRYFHIHSCWFFIYYHSFFVPFYVEWSKYFHVVSDIPSARQESHSCQANRVKFSAVKRVLLLEGPLWFAYHSTRTSCSSVLYFNIYIFALMYSIRSLIWAQHNMWCVSLNAVLIIIQMAATSVYYSCCFKIICLQKKKNTHTVIMHGPKTFLI